MARRRSNNNKSKGKKPYFNNKKDQYRKPKNKGKENADLERSEEVREANTGKNDVSWMILDPNMLAGISNYNFITPIGRMLASYSDSVPTGSGSIKASAIPGICRYDYMPTPGISRTNDDAPAECASRLRNLLARKSGRIGDYDKADVFNAIYAATQPYLALNETKRMYRVMNGFSYYNEYTPEMLAESMFFDYDDWMEHYQEIPSKINWWLKQIEFFALPEGFPVLYKYLQLSDGIYKDSDSLYAQWYYFSAEVYWKFNDLGETGNELVPVAKYYSRVNDVDITDYPVGSNEQWQDRNPWTWGEWVTLVDDLIESLRGSDSFKKVWDDFLRVYETSGKVMLAPVEQGEKLIPFYDPEIIKVVNAMRITPRSQVRDNTGYHGVWYPIIKQNAEINAGYPIFRYFTWNPELGKPQASAVNTYYLGAPAINTYVDTPTVEDMLYISQATPTFRSRSLEYGTAWEVDSCSVFLVTNASILKRIQTESGYTSQSINIHSNVIPRITVSNNTYVSDNSLEVIYELNTFSTHPLLIGLTDSLAASGTSNLSSPFKPFTDVDHIVFMTKERIKNFHEVQVYSFLRCPGWDYSNNRAETK